MNQFLKIVDVKTTFWPYVMPTIIGLFFVNAFVHLGSFILEFCCFGVLTIILTFIIQTIKSIFKNLEK